MGKLSGFPPSSSPTLADLFVMIQAAGPTDIKVTVQNMMNLMFSGQVQTQANAGTAGGNIWWVNLGGLKLLWGQTATLSVAASTTTAFGVTLPTFLTTLQTLVTGFQPSGSTANYSSINSSSVSAFSFYVTNPTGTPSIGGGVNYLAIGT